MDRVIIGDAFSDTGAILCKTLQQKGIEVIETPRHGNQVFQTIMAVQPDVVVIEMYMAELDAVQLMRKVRRCCEKWPVFIVMTADTAADTKRRLISNGASYVALKPFHLEQMTEIITNFLYPDKHVSDSELWGFNLHTAVTQLLMQLGIPLNINGFRYLRTGIMLCVDNPELINAITKVLYPQIAKQCRTTAHCVERAIRYAIEKAWKDGDVDEISACLDYHLNKHRMKPSNSEFIAIVAEKMRITREQTKKHS